MCLMSWVSVAQSLRALVRSAGGLGFESQLLFLIFYLFIIIAGTWLAWETCCPGSDSSTPYAAQTTRSALSGVIWIHGPLIFMAHVSSSSMASVQVTFLIVISPPPRTFTITRMRSILQTLVWTRWNRLILKRSVSNSSASKRRGMVRMATSRSITSRRQLSEMRIGSESSRFTFVEVTMTIRQVFSYIAVFRTLIIVYV